MTYEWEELVADVEDITPSMRNGIELALAQGGGTHQLRHVLDAIMTSEAQLWIDGDSLLITEVNDTPLLRELHVWIATGDLDGCIALSEKVGQWGYLNGCQVMTLQGRLGWKKALRHHGWEALSIEMYKPL